MPKNCKIQIFSVKNYKMHKISVSFEKKFLLKKEFHYG